MGPPLDGIGRKEDPPAGDVSDQPHDLWIVTSAQTDDDIPDSTQPLTPGIDDRSAQHPG